jgi:excisionase family DNA binding protein
MTDDFNPTGWITTKEAAELTSYNATHVRWLIREGRIEGRKFGRDWMVQRQSLEEYAEEMKKLGRAKHDPWRTGARKREKED